MDTAECLKRVRERNPLVHHITNYVTVNDCANACLAVGGSPVMADALEEAADMSGISDALVLNIGTLNADKVKAMILAGKAANKKGIPVIFDPVGCGATSFRNRMAEELEAGSYGGYSGMSLKYNRLPVKMLRQKVWMPERRAALTRLQQRPKHWH